MPHVPVPVRAILFPADPDEPVVALEVDGSPAGVQAAVDGQTEVVSLGDAGAVMFVNAYGKSKRLPSNPRATRFVDAFVEGFAGYDLVAGPAVVVGEDTQTYARVDVPAAVIEAALRG